MTIFEFQKPKKREEEMLTIETPRGSFQFTRYARIQLCDGKGYPFAECEVASLLCGFGVRVSVGHEIKIKGYDWLPITAVSWCASLDREEIARRNAIDATKKAAEEERKQKEAAERCEIEALSSAML